jgi:hypothetical protein
MISNIINETVFYVSSHSLRAQLWMSGHCLFLLMPVGSSLLLEEKFEKESRRKWEAEEKRIERFRKEVEQNCQEWEKKKE